MLRGGANSSVLYAARRPLRPSKSPSLSRRGTPHSPPHTHTYNERDPWASSPPQPYLAGLSDAPAPFAWWGGWEWGSGGPRGSITSTSQPTPWGSPGESRFAVEPCPGLFLSLPIRAPPPPPCLPVSPPQHPWGQQWSPISPREAFHLPATGEPPFAHGISRDGGAGPRDSFSPCSICPRRGGATSACPPGVSHWHPGHHGVRASPPSRDANRTECLPRG